jgi:hypothetical protein
MTAAARRSQMSRIVRTLIASLGFLVVGAAPASAFGDWGRARDLECAITPATPFFSGTYRNVTVPANAICNLSNSTVYGNVTVQNGGSINFEDSGSVGGQVFVGHDGVASEATGWAIWGPMLADGAGSVNILGTVHGVFVRDTGTLGVQSATIDGSIVSTGGTFGGAIVASVIRGNVIISATKGGPGGSSSADWFIAGPQLGGQAQEIGGNVVLTANQGPIYLLDNHVRRNLICVANNPAPVTAVPGESNTVDGRSVGQCSAADPVESRADSQGGDPWGP